MYRVFVQNWWKEDRYGTLKPDSTAQNHHRQGGNRSGSKRNSAGIQPDSQPW